MKEEQRSCGSGWEQGTLLLTLSSDQYLKESFNLDLMTHFFVVLDEQTFSNSHLLTVLVRVVIAVNLTVTELVNRLA